MISWVSHNFHGVEERTTKGLSRVIWCSFSETFACSWSNFVDIIRLKLTTSPKIDSWLSFERPCVGRAGTGAADVGEHCLAVQLLLRE